MKYIARQWVRYDHQWYRILLVNEQKDWPGWWNHYQYLIEFPPGWVLEKDLLFNFKALGNCDQFHSIMRPGLKVLLVNESSVSGKKACGACYENP